MHVDDQMDAKSVVGAYVTTAVPGEFAWAAGPLTQVHGALASTLCAVFWSLGQPGQSLHSLPSVCPGQHTRCRLSRLITQQFCAPPA